MNNNYYQSDIKTSRQEDSIYAMRYASQQMLIDKLQEKLEAYENMRKEAIKWIDNYLKMIEEPEKSIVLTDDVVISCLLNILNKVGGSDE